jgi:cation-transporting ATPase 13A1
MFKILSVNSLISAYVMSLLFLKGLRQGDTQLVVQGLLVAAFFYCVSQSSPCIKLAAYRPPSRLFSLPVVCSVLAQFAVHIVCLFAAVTLCEPYIEDGEGGAAFAMVDNSTATSAAAAGAAVNGSVVNGSAVNGTIADDDATPPFKGTVFNTCIWLIGSLMLVNTFAVNSRGHPFMEDFWRNKKLLYCTMLAYAVIVLATSEVFPPINDALELAPLPSESFRFQLVAIFAVDLFGVFGLERLVEMCFA